MNKHANYQSTLKTSKQNTKKNFGEAKSQNVMAFPQRKNNRHMSASELLAKGMKNIAHGKD